MMADLVKRTVEALAEATFGKRLLQLKEREVLALERIADALEALLPSPFASPQLQDSPLRPLTADEGGYKTYDQREAFRDQLRRPSND